MSFVRRLSFSVVTVKCTTEGPVTYSDPAQAEDLRLTL
jgi:hypothetical protein